MVQSSATQLQTVLQDYTIHLTGAGEEQKQSVTAEQQVKPEQEERLPESREVECPWPNWPNDYRDVPTYRPINRSLDFNERPGGRHFAERAFIYTMLHGVWLNAKASRTWNYTAGRLNKNLFRYPIGGEW
ncbi:hypothetical protein B0O99DRAFT_508123 [Bisporella sp. PMI_857]|nr:hypothetical protein B0O99DRAFT_508123 [Bisporella sp. PMI_857]